MIAFYLESTAIDECSKTLTSKTTAGTSRSVLAYRCAVSVRNFDTKLVSSISLQIRSLIICKDFR